MVRVTLIQLEECDNKECVRHAIDKIEKAMSIESEFICLPEKWYKGKVTDIIPLIKEISTTNNACIIAGAFIEELDGKNYVSSPVICDGEIIGRQLKIHPFKSESDVNGGNRLNLFEHRNTRFGIVVCYDIVFPEIARRIALKGADMIFAPSKIYDKGILPWHIYVQARALENRLAVIAPNVCNNGFGGCSIIARLSYDEVLDIAETDIVQASANSEQVLVSDIDLEELRRIRSIRLDKVRDDYHLM